MARSQAFNAEMGLGQITTDDPLYPGNMSYVYSEEAARGLYTQWGRMMSSPTWADLNQTRPALADHAAV